MRLTCLAAALLLLGVAITAQTTDAVKVARTTVDRLVEGDYAAIIQSFDDKTRALLTEERLRAAWEPVRTQAGALKRVNDPRLVTKGEFRAATFLAEFERANVDIQVVVNPAGQVVGLNVRPAASTAPFVDAAYVDRSKFTERDVTVDAGGWPLPGTLAMPNVAGPVPAVVLVHGSGPNDRDETIGANKPFRDLALGLASRGIATLRYEKRTRQHGARLAGLTQFTVKEETVDDAVAAVRLLRKTDGIDARRVFVLGHSLGGMLAPRIADAAGTEVAGLVIMAGAVRSLEQSLVDQTRYLALADGTISPNEQQQIDKFVQLVATVAVLKPTDPPVTFAGVSGPASYWVDLRGYSSVDAARAVKLPMLILQGERDYQVTTEDFGKWKEALGSRSDVTLKLYPPLNHAFIAGTGKSLPGEYLQAGHVASDVVSDVAVWIAAR
jgi:dienelactone hydrolase